MKFKLASKISKSTPSSPKEICKSFLSDTSWVSGIYTVFIGITIGLEHTAHTLVGSFKYHVAKFLEESIFYSGSLVYYLVLCYVTLIAILNLKLSFNEYLNQRKLTNNSKNKQNGA